MLRDANTKSLLNDGGYGPPPFRLYQRWNPRESPGDPVESSFSNSSLKSLIFNQARINESLNLMLLDHDKILGEIHVKMHIFYSAIREQLDFNKKIEAIGQFKFKNLLS